MHDANASYYLARLKRTVIFEKETSLGCFDPFISRLTHPRVEAVFQNLHLVSFSPRSLTLSPSFPIPNAQKLARRTLVGASNEPAVGVRGIDLDEAVAPVELAFELVRIAITVAGAFRPGGVAGLLFGISGSGFETLSSGIANVLFCDLFACAISPIFAATPKSTLACDGCNDDSDFDLASFPASSSPPPFSRAAPRPRYDFVLGLFLLGWSMSGGVEGGVSSLLELPSASPESPSSHGDEAQLRTSSRRRCVAVCRSGGGDSRATLGGLDTLLAPVDKMIVPGLGIHARGPDCIRSVNLPFPSAGGAGGGV
jgi:hypothetical protein